MDEVLPTPSKKARQHAAAILCEAARSKHAKLRWGDLGWGEHQKIAEEITDVADWIESMGDDPEQAEANETRNNSD